MAPKKGKDAKGAAGDVLCVMRLRIRKESRQQPDQKASNEEENEPVIYNCFLETNLNRLPLVLSISYR